MSSSTAAEGLPALPRRWIAAAVAVGALVGYTAAVRPVVHSVSQVAYPLAWLATSAGASWVFLRPRLDGLSRRGLAVGAGYALALLWTAGLVGPSTSTRGLSVHLAVPGWGPAVVYGGPVVSLSLVPFLVVGYLTLGLLAAVVVDRTWRASAPGLLGLFACVSCTAPLIAGLAGSLGAGSLATAVSHAQYPVATGAFLAAVGGFALVLRTAERGGPVR